MRAFLCCCAISWAVIGIAPFALSNVVETFILPMEPVPVWCSDFMDDGREVGPEGDIWLILPMPERLMRISGDQIQCVFDSGIMVNGGPPLTFSPDGPLWIGNFKYVYSPEQGLHESGLEIPPTYSGPGASTGVWRPMIDMNCRMFLCGGSSSWDYHSSCVWEVRSGESPLKLFEAQDLQFPFLVSADEFCAYIPNHWGGQESEIDLDASVVKGEYGDFRIRMDAEDSEGLMWFAGYTGISTFDHGDFSRYCEPGDGVSFQWPLVLTADWTVWVGTATAGALRIRGAQGEEQRFFTTEEGLLTNRCRYPKIDYDGRVWFFNANDEGIIGLSRITDGGWPPMRLMLHRLETPEGIAVEAQVINNGPVVGVDVYVALELNGQLLFWPNWQPERCPVQVNLRPGHNQTAVIISAPGSSIPPGSYTFYGCMTGRNTQKLIGPLDRKFESLTIEIN